MIEPAGSFRAPCAEAHSRAGDDSLSASGTASRRGRATTKQSAPAARVLIFADHAERAAALKRIFARLGHTVHVALNVRERRRLLRQHPPGIVIISTDRHDTTTDRAIEEITGDGTARVVLVVTRDAAGRTVVNLLRQGSNGYVRTSSITLADYSPNHSVWTWIAALANTLSLEPEARQRTRRPTRPA